MAPSIQSSVNDRRSYPRRSFPVRFLLISVTAHACLFLVCQKAVSWPLSPARPEIFHVQLLREPIETASEGREPAEAAPIEPGSFQLQDEDTIRLGGEKGEYQEYAGLIKKRLAEAWVYPEQARLEAIEGTVGMRFTLESDGRLSGSRMLSSSNHSSLDENVMEAVTRAAPYPPFPDHFSISRLHIEASFTYRLAAPGNSAEHQAR